MGADHLNNVYYIIYITIKIVKQLSQHIEDIFETPPSIYRMQMSEPNYNFFRIFVPLSICVCLSVLTEREDRVATCRLKLIHISVKGHYW